MDAKLCWLFLCVNIVLSALVNGRKKHGHMRHGKKPHEEQKAFMVRNYQGCYLADIRRCSENIQQIYRRTPNRSVISIKLRSNVIEITLRHGRSPVNLLHIFRMALSKNTYGGLFLKYIFILMTRVS